MPPLPSPPFPAWTPLVAGHTHQIFPSAAFPPGAGIDPKKGLLSGKPAVMPGFHGSHLGVIDLDLRHSADGHWTVAKSHVELRPITRRTRAGRIVAKSRNAAAIVSLSRNAHLSTRRWASAPLGHSDTPLHSYFSLVQPCPAVRLIALAQADHVARRLRGGPYADLPILSAAAPFHAGGRGGPDNYTAIPAGDLVMRNTADLYPHPNTIAALRVTGADLAQWLERSFSIHNQITPTAGDAELINPLFPSFNFDLIEGLSWSVDLSVPAQFDTHGIRINSTTRRIRDLRFQDSPLDPNGVFVLATNSYRAAGSGGFPGASLDNNLLTENVSSRDILLRYIIRLGTLPPSPPPNWRFAPLGASVVFDSAPGATEFTSDLAAMDGTPLQLTQDGFRRFRLHL